VRENGGGAVEMRPRDANVVDVKEAGDDEDGERGPGDPLIPPSGRGFDAPQLTGDGWLVRAAEADNRLMYNTVYVLAYTWG